MTLSVNPRTRDDLVVRCVDEDFAVYDPVRDRLALLNPSAALVFDLCDGSNTLQDIVAEVIRAFALDASVEAGDLHAQIRESLLQLERQGMLHAPDG